MSIIISIAEENNVRNRFGNKLTHSKLNQKQSSNAHRFIPCLVALPHIIQAQVFSNLSIKDLNSLELALGKHKFKDTLEVVAKVRSKEILKDRLNRILDELLKNHPNWLDAVNSWAGISIENKIWILRVFELIQLGFPIPQIEELFDEEGHRLGKIPEGLGLEQYVQEVRKRLRYTARSLRKLPKDLTIIQEILKMKPEITAKLNSIHEWDFTDFSLQSIPDAIGLLTNIEVVYIYRKKSWLTHLSHNSYLKPYLLTDKVFAKAHLYPKIKFY